MLLGYDEAVDLSLRLNIEECVAFFVFIYLFRGDVTADYSAEYTHNVSP
jgi:hypothetical protein